MNPRSISSKTKRTVITLVTSLAAFTHSFSTGSAAPAPIPVVLATDIGGDIDDIWALAHLLRSPELDVKMVLTDNGDATYRARVTAKFLEVAGRTDVHVGLGPSSTDSEEKDQLQGPWVRDYDLSKYPGRVHPDGVGAFLELVRNSPEPVTVIAIGPAPSLAEAVTRDPHFAKKCRLVGMFGSFDIGYDGGSIPAAEWNVRADVKSLRTVMAAPWQDKLLTPLDTCGMIHLAGDNYRSVWNAAPTDPVIRAVIENYSIWAPRVFWMKCDFFVTRTSTLFDDVAVYLAYAEDLVEIETVQFAITDDGFTVRDKTGPFTARVALRWKDRDAFEARLARRLLGIAAPRTN
jgi:inosine-uridine nucleoside N-ribohydrolase